MGPVSRVEVIAVRPPMPPVQYTGFAPPAIDTMTLVKLTDEDGTVGIASYDTDSYDQADLASLEALRAPAAAVVGQDPNVRLRIGAEARSLLPTPITAPGPASAIETALWDLAAKNAGLPLYQYLGGMRDEMPGYASLPVSDGVSACIELVAESRNAGFECVKLHVSGQPRADAALALRVREAFTDLEVMWDAEGVYDRRGAAYVGAALDEIDARWFEAPLPDQDLAGYRDLRRRVSVPLVPAGDFFWDTHAIADALSDPPWDAVRSEASAGGGIGFGCRLAGLVEAFGLEAELASYGFGLTQAANLHLMLGLGTGTYFEQAFPAEPWTFGLAEPYPFGFGKSYRGTDRPGLGITLDDAQIETAVVARFVADR
jgi:L-alanine-DL-glutamate epimerase-like enolase superfamily enzyme